MSSSTLLAVAASISSDWARRGGPRSEFAIACRGDVLSAVVEMEVGKRFDDAGRRAALGAVVPMTRCSTFGYLADATTTVDGRPGDSLLLLELEIVDAAERIVGAKVYTASYWRSKRRFGNDVIGLDAFIRCEAPVFGDMLSEITTVWNLVDDAGRVGAMNILSETGARLSDVDPVVQSELQHLLGQPV